MESDKNVLSVLTFGGFVVTLVMENKHTFIYFFIRILEIHQLLYASIHAVTLSDKVVQANFLCSLPFFFYHCKVCVGVLCLQKVKVMTHHSSTRLSCCFTTSSSKTQVVGFFLKFYSEKCYFISPRSRK